MFDFVIKCTIYLPHKRFVKLLIKQFMKVKREILEIIDNMQSRLRIALSIGTVGEQAVRYQIMANNDNGRMTKMDFLAAISKETGIPVNEILEEVTINAED